MEEDEDSNISAKQEREVYLTLNELCELLKIPKPTIYDYTHQKKIPFVKIGKLLRFPLSVIESWLKNPEETLRLFFDNSESSMSVDTRLRRFNERR